MDKSLLFQLLLPIIILQLILMITALSSLVKQQNTKGSKWLWAVIIIFVNLLGPVIYFVFGRKDR
ncbi:PLDc_N domain-containing protein [Bacillus sp. Gen3]|uniref:PLD nuclease N-terminal domain-containing protein n=1 Tax=Heyndrickxia oleronia TaxID=38875 RepID=A0AAW6SQJ5_9BACI|nr:PLD nuclease N-terminal domain-containing protein [Heyndrickxia oleronia]MDH5159510.1 PLD nuclease N-terminal domain-containing protein [Heyndrickxia oleronia]NYV65048.1 PLDc_N domain-containing protein [Bacillus sp. Gen3]